MYVIQAPKPIYLESILIRIFARSLLIAIASTFSARELNMRSFFSVPFARNPDFVGREDHIQEIEKRFSGPGKNHFVAVHGLGGIG